MRGLCLILLLMNVAFFGWAHWIDAPGSAEAAPTAHALPTLALMPARTDGTAVAPSAPAPAAPAPAAAAGAASADARCRSLGPFTSAAAARLVAGQLRARGLSPTDRSVDISLNDGYSVYIDQSGDAAARRRAVARLNQAGIQEAVLGAPAGRISLGVYADQARAVRRAEQVRQLGFKPVLDIHQSAVSTHWLDINLEPNEPTPPVGQLLGDAQHVAAEPAIAFSDCPTTGSSG